MKTALLVFGVLALVAVLTVGGLAMGYWGWSNDCRQAEADITGQYTDMQNVYDNGWKKVVEISQVPAMQMDNYKVLYTDVMKGRYGADGSKAMFQFLKEQNPTLDPALYTKLQQTVEIFHNDFSASQTKLTAEKVDYKKLIEVGGGRVYNVFGGYPRIHVGIPVGSQDDYQIVTSGKTQTDFKNHSADALDLRKSSGGADSK